MAAKSHPNKELVYLYVKKQYQGADPEKAKFLFIGLDANFDPKIDRNPIIFPRVIEYLRDGVDFWREHGIHHPLLLPEYRGMGRYYHERFQEIGFAKDHAEDVSFLNILHYPTRERRKAFAYENLCNEHLCYLEKIITSDREKLVFVSFAALSTIKKGGTNRFLSRLAYDKGTEETHGTYCSDRVWRVWEDNGTKVYRISHFSARPQGKEKGYPLTAEDMDKIAEIAGIKR